MSNINNINDILLTGGIYMKMKKLNYIIAGSLLSALVFAGCGNDKPNQEVQKIMTETQKDLQLFKKVLLKIQL